MLATLRTLMTQNAAGMAAMVKSGAARRLLHCLRQSGAQAGPVVGHTSIETLVGLLLLLARRSEESLLQLRCGLRLCSTSSAI